MQNTQKQISLILKITLSNIDEFLKAKGNRLF